ncbi:bifunctional GNAT family N-acetyltransferase/NUDIX hydrolase [Streptomyces niveus]|uniref:bifunctional GNAT family N-acetyltransferase/NUDIX hydrolase n=1 Tax=Streptomyces niveus TaxID=193462 RepID=UPI0033F78C2F
MNTDMAPTATPEPRDDPGRPPVRAATPADAEAIIRMRSQYVLSAPMTEEWIRRCTDELAPRLAPEGDARAFVVEASDGAMAACALGLIHPVLPARSYPRGLAARVQLVATRPEARRRGHARAVVSALLDHLADENVTLFELHTSAEAAPLYREFGFSGDPALMRMTRHSTSTDALADARTDSSWVPPEQHAQSLPKAVAFVCLYVTDEDDRPLQLHSVYSPGHPWHMIGGAMDLGERPWDAVVRECREETGMTAAGPPRLLATVYGQPREQRPYSTLQLIFDGGRLTDAQIRGITLNPREHDEVRVLPLVEWEALMPARGFVRLRAVEEARRTGVAAYVDTWGNA